MIDEIQAVKFKDPSTVRMVLGDLVITQNNLTPAMYKHIVEYYPMSASKFEVTYIQPKKKDGKEKAE